jgi:predicted CopG family antitoxin
MIITLYTPHSNQRKIHDSIKNDPCKYYVLNIGRQFGKSLLGTNQALDWFFNESNVRIGWVSPIYKQCKKVFTDIDTAFGNNAHVFKEKNKTDLIFKAHKGSTLQFFSSESYDNIRGETFDYLIVDEAAWQQEAAWNEVLRATVLVRGKKVLFLSTPKGKNWFYNLHSLDGVNPQYKSFTMTSYDNPLITPSEINDARLTLPDNVFKQEYLAEFIDGGAGVFKKVEIKPNPAGSNKYYAGIDLGRADDYTVLTILNERSEMVYCERWRHDAWGNIVNKLVAVLKHWSNPVTLVEVNSIGDVVHELIKNQYKGTIEPFITTSKSKQDIIEGLQVAIQNKEFTMLPIDWLGKEFELFTYEYSQKTRSIRYSSPPGFHDDGVMSCAIAYEALKKLKHSGKYSFA